MNVIKRILAMAEIETVFARPSAKQKPEPKSGKKEGAR